MATRSTCDRKHVGAVITRGKTILATGYNGSIRSLAHCDDAGHEMENTHCVRTIHAEANAIMHCAILGIEAGVQGAILYSTFVPCLECSKMAITLGIKKFVCLDEYPETDYDLIKEAGVEIEILDKTKIEKWAGKLIPKKE